MLCLLAGAARADEIAEFNEHYQRALSTYKAADYEGAIREFQAAYALHQLPRLLLNIGQAHRKLGHARDALGFYEFYLRVEPNPKPEIKAELETYIKQTRVLLSAAERIKDEQSAQQEAREQDQEAESPAERWPVRVAEPDPGQPWAAPAQASRLPLLPSGHEDTGKPQRPRKRTALWIGLGVAAGLLVAGAVTAGAVLAIRPVNETTLALENAR